MCPRELYEEKYLDESPQALNSLVATHTSGAKILRLYDFEKEGEVYPALKDKKITDVGGGFSSLVFEVLPSVQEITLIDPIYMYDKEIYLAKELLRAERRLRIHETLTSDVTEDIHMRRKKNNKEEREVIDGMIKWKNYDFSTNEKIIFNTSFAQNIKGIDRNSQDITFLNFVLDKLQGYEGIGKEVHAALDEAYRITKSGGKIYCLQDNDYKSEILLDVMQHIKHKRNAHYKDNRKYVVFTIDKEG